MRIGPGLRVGGRLIRGRLVRRGLVGVRLGGRLSLLGVLDVLGGLVGLCLRVLQRRLSIGQRVAGLVVGRLRLVRGRVGGVRPVHARLRVGHILPGLVDAGLSLVDIGLRLLLSGLCIRWIGYNVLDSPMRDE